MIYQESLSKFKTEVVEAVEELFSFAYKNQTHPQDLLLVDQHGFFDEMLAKPEVKARHNLSPYVLGPGFIGHSDSTHYEFIDWYRQNHTFNKEEYENKKKEDPNFEKAERLSIHIELLIYLKFWEADLNLKRLYQLTRLCRGENYDWLFELPKDPREGSRHEVIRIQIRDSIKDICPKFYQLIKSIYIPQLRNAIAHSQFAFFGKIIDLLNYSENPKAYCPKKAINMDEWDEIFHKTILMHNELIRNFQHYVNKYSEFSKKNHNKIDLRITLPDATEKIEHVGKVNDRDEWIWYKNLRPEDFEQIGRAHV